MKEYTILSLGAGVQSSVVLLLACKGILPKPDAAIFADTQWEPMDVYVHLDWLEEQATQAGIPLFRRSRGNIKDDALRVMVPRTMTRQERWASMPFYTKTGGNEREGMIRRQCTSEYKLNVIERTIRQDILGLKKGERVPADVQVTQWIGISIDEKRRMRLSNQRWRINEYPLIGWPTEVFATPKTREWCKTWFAEHYPGRHLPRSACIGCPLRSNEEWREMREHRPKEWTEAVEFDAAIRHCGGIRDDTYLHRSCLPLDEVDLSAKTDPKQNNLFANECLGMCGV